MWKGQCIGSALESPKSYRGEGMVLRELYLEVRTLISVAQMF